MSKPIVNTTNLHQRPLKLAPNRVWRTYRGGKVLDQWQGAATPRDGERPERWLASMVEARNPHSMPGEGLSFLQEKIGGERLSLKQTIERNPEAFLGQTHARHYGANTGVLIKLLDSAERLTIQVHPDRQTAKRVFGSEFGKTEGWYVLGGREMSGVAPFLMLGFQPGITREYWQHLFERQDVEGMMRALHCLPLRPGEVFLVEGGVPHAIGPGCVLVEIQEPTDFTLRVERTTPRGHQVPDSLCHQGAGFERLFDFFDYNGYDEATIRKMWCLPPQTLFHSEAGSRKRRIGYEHTCCFAMELISVRTALEAVSPAAPFSVLVVVAGRGKLQWKGDEMGVRRGDEIFLPAGVHSLRCVNLDAGELQVLQCFPPRASIPAKTRHETGTQS